MMHKTEETMRTDEKYSAESSQRILQKKIAPGT